jgi:signal transduction histidine kinase
MLLQRPIFKWLLFTGCVGLFVAAMAWVTHRMCAMDRDRHASEHEAQLQERVRLALWRMDSLVNALLIRENSRPASHYQPFHSPEDLFSNRSQQELPKGEAVMPSPLLGEPPEFVTLHFQLLRGITSSPQVPTGTDLTLANNWYAISPQLEMARKRLARLDGILRKHPGFVPVTRAAPVPAGAARPSETALAPAASPPPSPVTLQVPQLKTAEQKIAPDQIAANNMEFQQRSKVTSDNYLGKDLQKLNGPLPKKKEDSYSLARKQAAAAAPAPAAAPAAASKSVALLAEAGKPGRPSLASSMAGAGRTQSAQKLEGALTPSPPATPAVTLDMPATVPPPAEVPGDLKPQWIENELFLLRTVTLDGQARVQGLWLDWPKLRTKLVDTIIDLLPNAELSATDPAWLDASSLVTLPVRLLPGKIEVTVADSSPLHRSLALAWACFGITALAVGIVLHRAMLLSERRGAFVSAVTHELRTPLTTFQLYSEMLADDMVPDAGQRREYLRTLCDESTRLTHLVENVLSYSRIERGRAAARRDTVLLSDFVARIEPRLRQRTQQTGLDLQVNVSADAAETKVNIDALAVEQIIFNLVDNACKYAAPASKERALHLEITVEPSQAVIRVRDHGPGLSRQQLKRLFRPFEKSATEAAHSAPGVGLGLALCRRLARELHGDLVLESRDSGACFKLTVPVSA